MLNVPVSLPPVAMEVFRQLENHEWIGSWRKTSKHVSRIFHCSC